MSDAPARIDADRLRNFIGAAFRRLGMPGDDAATVAALMAEADLQGSDGHGVIRLPHYARRIRAGGLNLHPAMRGCRAAWHGADRRRQWHGPSVTTRCQLAIEKARTAGVAWVGAR
jgi:LDH2 family malate/lactate/ureidoglycolate dehydrogenase